MKKRRILPRREVSRLDPVDFIKKSTGVFNDLDTIFFSGSMTLDMPSGLPRGNSLPLYVSSTYGRQLSDIVSQSDAEGLYVTGTMTWDSFDRFVYSDPLVSGSADPFKEDALFDQGTQDLSFFSTGSDPKIGNGSLRKPLTSKVQIKKSFSVKTQQVLPAATSSFYYFDVAAGSWIIPDAVKPILTDPFKKTSFPTVVFCPPSINGTSGSLYIEDAIGFDAYGNFLASGSRDILRQGSDTKSTYYFPAEEKTNSSLSVFLSIQQDKSFTNSLEFKAQDAQQFEVTISRPFMLEKATVSIPVCAGPDWFLDKTVSLFITGSGDDLKSGSSYSIANEYSIGNSGGPAVSVALLHQKRFVINGADLSIRDVICHASFTHSGDVADATYDIIQRRDPDRTLVTPAGIGSEENGANVGSVVTVPDNLYFTGSVSVNMTSRSECGIAGHVNRVFPGSTVTKAASQLKTVLSTKKFPEKEKFINLESNAAGEYGIGIAAIVPFGRSHTGLTGGGTSPFGRDFLMYDFGPGFRNPGYSSNTSTVDEAVNKFSDVYDGSSPFGVQGYSNNIASKDSPYLLMPGDKLILCATKTRPAYQHLMGVNVAVGSTVPLNVGKFTYTSSSYYNSLRSGRGHDIMFNTGSIDITLFGTYVSNGGEYSR